MHTMIGGESVLMAFLIWIVVGAIIGWLAGLLIQGGGFGFIADALIGILGSVVAGWLFPRLGISLGGGLIGSILASIVGAVIVIVVIRLLRRLKRSTAAAEKPAQAGRMPDVARPLSLKPQRFLWHMRVRDGQEVLWLFRS